MASEHIQVKVEDHIAVVTLNRPPVNAFTRDMYLTMHDVFHELSLDRNVRCAILTGGGDRIFCGGNDINAFRNPDAGHVADGYRVLERMLQAIHFCEVPVIGAINGPALGTGLALTAICDVLIATPNATFGIPELTVGTIGGARFLMRLVPQHKARWMALTGQRILAEDLYRYGALEKIVPPAELMSTALEMAHKIAGAPPSGIRLQKLALNDGEFMDLEEGNMREHYYARILRATPDSLEAAKAFLEKRPPKYE